MGIFDKDEFILIKNWFASSYSGWFWDVRNAKKRT